LESEELAAVIRFRGRLSDSPDAVIETARSAEDVKEAREALGLPRIGDVGADAVFGKVVESLVEGEPDTALETLREEFGTPCEGEEPPDYTVDGGGEHVASCLLYDERFGGEKS
jgi:hypothetical protein